MKSLVLVLVLGIIGAWVFGCGGGGGGSSPLVKAPTGNLAVQSGVLAGYQTLSAGRYFLLPAIEAAAPSGAFAGRVGGGSSSGIAVRPGPRASSNTSTALAQIAPLGLYTDDGVINGSQEIFSYFTDVSGTSPAGTIKMTVEGGQSIGNYTSYPVTVDIDVNVTGGNLPCQGTAKAVFGAASGQNTLKGSLTLTKNQEIATVDLALSDLFEVSGTMTILENGSTISISNVSGVVTQNLALQFTMTPQNDSGIGTMNLMTGELVLVITDPAGASCNVDGAGDLLINFGDGTSETVANPLMAGLLLPIVESEVTTPLAGVYITDADADAVLVFGLDAGATDPPQRTIQGAKTGLAHPMGIAVDSKGMIYVANRDGASVTVYPPDSNGDVEPLRTLTAGPVLSDFGMGTPQAVAIDGGDNVYVGTCPACAGAEPPYGLEGVFHFPKYAEMSDFRVDAGEVLGLASFEDGGLTVLTPSSVDTYAAGVASGSKPFHSLASDESIQSMAVGAGVYAFTEGTISGQGKPGIALWTTSAVWGTGPGPSATIAAENSFNLSSAFGGIFIDDTITQPAIYVISGNKLFNIATAGGAPSLSMASFSTIGAGSFTNPSGLAVVLGESPFLGTFSSNASENAVCETPTAACKAYGCNNGCQDSVGGLTLTKGANETEVTTQTVDGCELKWQLDRINGSNATLEPNQICQNLPGHISGSKWNLDFTSGTASIENGTITVSLQANGYLSYNNVASTWVITESGTFTKK